MLLCLTVRILLCFSLIIPYLPHTKCPGVFLRGISSMNYLAKSDGSIGLIISAWNTPCARMRPSN
jgi:hypothetical protein